MAEKIDPTVRFPKEEVLASYLNQHLNCEEIQISEDIIGIIANFFAEQTLDQLRQAKRLMDLINNSWWQLPFFYLKPVTDLVIQTLANSVFNKVEKKETVEHVPAASICKKKPVDVFERRHSFARSLMPSMVRKLYNSSTTATKSQSITPKRK